MKDLETDLQKAFEKVLAGKQPDFDSLNNIDIQEIEIADLKIDIQEIDIADLDIDIPMIEFEEFPTATTQIAREIFPTYHKEIFP